MGAYEHYLAHHGIKGQMWGRRRYQNEDGSLTEEGKQRYGSDSDEGSNSDKKNVKITLPDYGKAEKKLMNDSFTKQEISEGLNGYYKLFETIGMPKSSFEQLADKPEDEQLFYLINLAGQMGLYD